MKAAEIRVGGYYQAKVSGKLTTVRVNAIREFGGLAAKRLFGGPQTSYDVTNLATGRKITFRSAAKFRRVVEVKSGVQMKADGEVPVIPAEHKPTKRPIDPEYARPEPV
jgi:hypothetical protein